MAVTAVHELFEGRTGEDNYTRRRTYTRVFEVQTDDDANGPWTAGGSPLLPRLGESHPEDVYAVVVSVRPVQNAADPRLWSVEIQYDTQPDGGDVGEAAQPDGAADLGGDGGFTPPGELAENPLLRPPVWKVTFQQTTEAVRDAYWVDDAGAIVAGGRKALLNSAGLPFDPPVTIEVCRPVVSVTKNYPTFSLANAALLHDTVNLKTWYTVPPRVLRCVGVEAQTMFESGLGYWQVTYSFAINGQTWDHRILDCGYAVKYVYSDAATGVMKTGWKRIRDTAGNEITEPVPLDGFGGKLEIGGAPVFLRRLVYETLDYAKVIQL